MTFQTIDLQFRVDSLLRYMRSITLTRMLTSGQQAICQQNFFLTLPDMNQYAISRVLVREFFIRQRLIPQTANSQIATRQILVPKYPVVETIHTIANTETISISVTNLNIDLWAELHAEIELAPATQIVGSGPVTRITGNLMLSGRLLFTPAHTVEPGIALVFQNPQILLRISGMTPFSGLASDPLFQSLGISRLVQEIQGQLPTIPLSSLLAILPPVPQFTTATSFQARVGYYLWNIGFVPHGEGSERVITIRLQFGVPPCDEIPSAQVPPRRHQSPATIVRQLVAQRREEARQYWESFYRNGVPSRLSQGEDWGIFLQDSILVDTFRRQLNSRITTTLPPGTSVSFEPHYVPTANQVTIRSRTDIRQDIFICRPHFTGFITAQLEYIPTGLRVWLDFDVGLEFFSAVDCALTIGALAIGTILLAAGGSIVGAVIGIFVTVVAVGVLASVDITAFLPSSAVSRDSTTGRLYVDIPFDIGVGTLPLNIGRMRPSEEGVIISGQFPAVAPFSLFTTRIHRTWQWKIPQNCREILQDYRNTPFGTMYRAPVFAEIILKLVNHGPLPVKVCIRAISPAANGSSVYFVVANDPNDLPNDPPGGPPESAETRYRPLVPPGDFYFKLRIAPTIAVRLTNVKIAIQTPNRLFILDLPGIESLNPSSADLLAREAANNCMIFG